MNDFIQTNAGVLVVIAVTAFSIGWTMHAELARLWLRNRGIDVFNLPRKGSTHE